MNTEVIKLIILTTYFIFAIILVPIGGKNFFDYLRKTKQIKDITLGEIIIYILFFPIFICTLISYATMFLLLLMTYPILILFEKLEKFDFNWFKKFYSNSFFSKRLFK